MLGERVGTLGKLLQAHRHRRGLSQEELARLVTPPLSVNTIGNLERGRTRPYRHTLQLLGDALELSADERSGLLAAWHAFGFSAVAHELLGVDHHVADRRTLDSASPVTTPDVQVGHPPKLAGREVELALIAGLLHGTRLLTLTGAGSSGKTDRKSVV